MTAIIALIGGFLLGLFTIGIIGGKSYNKGYEDGFTDANDLWENGADNGLDNQI